MQNNIVYLAAGNSRRFGENKLLYPIADKPMYRHGLDLLLSILEEKKEYELYVVTQHMEIKQQVEQLFEEKEKQLGKEYTSRLHLVMSPDSEKGISYSMKAGILAAREDINAVFIESMQQNKKVAKENWYDTFFVADQPCFGRESLLGFMEGTISSGKIAGCVMEDGIYKNPVMFHNSLEEELLKLTGDTGGKKVFLKYEKESYCYPVEKECQDIDVRGDVTLCIKESGSEK